MSIGHLYFRTLIQARWRGFGTVVIMVKAHKPRVRPISVMTSRPTLKSDWLPVPVQGMASYWISPIPLIRSDWIRSSIPDLPTGTLQPSITTGPKVIFTDEWGGGGRPRCRAQDPLTWGADAFYDIVEGKLEFRSHYKMSAPQTETENCVAHNGSLIPVPGRDIFVQAWYQGGVSVVDFTDSANPVEIAFFDRGPIDTEELITAGYWSTYWYNGRIYGTEISRGLDVFEMQPSDFLTENEIAAAFFEALKGTVNAQTQERITWPAEPVVARAYQDQLLRTGAIDEAQSRELSEALNRAQRLLERGNSNRNAASELEALAGRFETSAQSLDGITAKRYLELAGTVAGIADAVR